MRTGAGIVKLIKPYPHFEGLLPDFAVCAAHNPLPAFYSDRGNTANTRKRVPDGNAPHFTLALL